MIGAVLGALLLASTPKGSARKILHPSTAEEYLTLAAAQLRLGDLPAAEDTARKGLAKHPEAEGFHLALADIAAARDRPADAYYEYQWEILRAGADSPTGHSAAERMGALLQNARGTGADEMRKVAEATVLTREDPAKAEKALAEVRAQRGDVFVLRLLLAEAEVEAGHSAKAVPLFRGLIADDPRFIPAYVELADVLRASGGAKNSKEANALEAKAKAIDPSSWALSTPVPGASPVESP